MAIFTICILYCANVDTKTSSCVATNTGKTPYQLSDKCDRTVAEITLVPYSVLGMMHPSYVMSAPGDNGYDHKIKLLWKKSYY